MKRCPECQRTYSDDTLQFCLEDGAALISEGAHSADETLVLNTPPSSTDDQELAITKEASSKETRAKTEPASAAQVRKSSSAPKSALGSTTKAMIAAGVAILFAAGLVFWQVKAGRARTVETAMGADYGCRAQGQAGRFR